VLGVAATILAVEIVGGLISGSLALMADAGHVFADNTAIAISIVVAVLIKKGSREDSVRSKGFYINCALLIFVALWILIEAYDRYMNPRNIISWVMITIAIIGMLGNYIQHVILHNVADEHKHQTHRALSLHVLSDLMMSVGVAVGGILIWVTGLYVLDPIISSGIALWFLWQTIKLILNPHGKHNH